MICGRASWSPEEARRKFAQFLPDCRVRYVSLPPEGGSYPTRSLPPARASGLDVLRLLLLWHQADQDVVPFAPCVAIASDEHERTTWRGSDLPDRTETSLQKTDGLFTGGPPV